MSESGCCALCAEVFDSDGNGTGPFTARLVGGCQCDVLAVQLPHMRHITAADKCYVFLARAAARVDSSTFIDCR
jgi:hypothetical protein